MHERLARLMAEGLDLRIVEPPVDLPPMREMAQFHSARQTDAGLSWLRKRLRALAHGTQPSSRLPSVVTG
jgi:hypothetical protein